MFARMWRRKELIQGNVQKDNFVEVWENKFEFFRSENKMSSKEMYLVKIGNPHVEIVCIHGILKKNLLFVIKDYMEDIFLFKRALMNLIQKNEKSGSKTE